MKGCCRQDTAEVNSNLNLWFGGGQFEFNCQWAAPKFFYLMAGGSLTAEIPTLLQWADKFITKLLLFMTEQLEPRIHRKFEIQQKLGKGAYGVVWKALHLKTGQVVALKKVFDAFQNATDAQRTYREVSPIVDSGHSSSRTQGPPQHNFTVGSTESLE